MSEARMITVTNTLLCNYAQACTCIKHMHVKHNTHITVILNLTLTAVIKTILEICKLLPKLSSAVYFALHLTT